MADLVRILGHTVHPLIRAETLLALSEYNVHINIKDIKEHFKIRRSVPTYIPKIMQAIYNVNSYLFLQLVVQYTYSTKPPCTKCM